MSNHYGFFNSHSNDVMQSVQGAFLISNTTPNAGTRPKGFGTYIYNNNIRHCIVLFCVRSIPKSTWINSNNVYMGREDKINE